MNQRFRLLVVAAEFPYPPNHGGRADIWRRLQMLNRLGCDISLICWYDDQPETRPSVDALAVVQREVSSLQTLPNQRGFKRNWLRVMQILKGIPSHVAARAVYGEQRAEIQRQAKAFAPDAVLLDSLYGGLLALDLSASLNVPLFYRSHNIEHRYFAGQAAAAQQLRDRMAWSLACLHLGRFEHKIMHSARVCFDISTDDIQWWAAQGVKAAQWLPPLSEAAISPPESVDAPPIRELAFLGNLHTPNNVQGIHWLVEQVMPIVWSLRPQTVLHVAGSRPTESIKTLFSSSDKLRIYENVPDVMAFLMNSAVLVNPVLTGSGVNVKTLDMLMTQRPIVSTSQGVAGLAPQLKGLCEVADSAHDFACCLVAQLDTPTVDVAKHTAGHPLFGPEVVQSMISRMRFETINKSSAV